jgi:hypothetical protein
LSHHRRIGGAALAALLFTGCGQGDDTEQNVARGRGLQVAALPADAHARVYQAAVGAAFDVGPSLTLLLDPRLLPRTAGVTGGQPMDPELAAALRKRGTIKGTCEPPTDGTRATPRCDAPAAGYVVRFSDVLELGPDSVEVYLLAQQYDTPASGAHTALQFEKAYQLVGRGGAWRVVREARVESEEAAPARPE